MDVPMLADQQELTYAATVCSLEDLQGVMDDRDGWREKDSGKSIQVVMRINFFFFQIYCGLFVLILVVFELFLLHYVSAKFHLWPSSGDLTVTLDRNVESCNCIPSNYCFP